MRKDILAGITFLIIGGIPAAVYAQRIDCYRQGDQIQCPGYGNFNYRNNSNNFDQTQIESSIREIYNQVLGRNADVNGLNTYTNAVRINRLSLAQVRRELVNSSEGNLTIRRTYQQGYGRNPNASQLRDAKLMIENGSSLEQLRQQFVGANNNPNNNFGDRLGDQRAAIATIYQQVLGREPDNGGLGAYSESIQNGRISLLQVRRELAYSGESDQNINKIYQQILGRNVDANGLRNSRRILESNNGTLDQVQNQLANVAEARNRNGDRTFTLQDLLGIFR
jgi:Domain of unknown function (DUF4214)